MITDRDDFRYREGNDSDSRDGGQSSENKSNGIIKKKRPRVGDVRTTGASPSNEGGYGNRDRDASREYRSSSYGSSYNNREDRPSYSDRRSYNNNSEGRSYNSERRPYNGGSSEGRSYNNDRGGRSYNNNNNTEGRSYNSYNNDRGGYGDRRPSYNNDRRQGGGGYNNDRRQQGGNRFGGGNKRPSKPREIDPNQKIIERPKRLIKPIKYKENLDPSTPLRLNKYLANAGVCSRREADSYITSGVVKVNGIVVSELGAKVTRGDLVTFQDKPVELESKVYVLLNKPKNCVTTSDDPQNRKTVMDLVKNACPERIYPVGRLDRNTTGVLLLTNDGDLASKLMHPKFKKKKIYQVTLDKDVAIEDMQAIADGIMLDDGEIHADSIAYVAEDVLNEIGIEIHSGRNRVVRRIFESLGYQVTKLDRVYFSGLTKKNLPRGRWRYLTEPEVNMLRMGSFE